ncbi:MAG: hypothetical protein PWQ57_1072 [Desulfovibrionales bacterium]|jgi:hypothetical protein|nr:hypothetical protein [Desulfovibrionales bacterium]
MAPSFHNDDKVLMRGVEEMLASRRKLGLEGLAGDLSAATICVEQDRLQPAAEELLASTGFDVRSAFEDDRAFCIVLGLDGSADLILYARKEQDNPFRAFNTRPKSGHLPNTRLETFIFETPDLARYVHIQQLRGTQFHEAGVVETPGYFYIQTQPSRYTGAALGFIQWKGQKGAYETRGAKALDVRIEKPDAAHLRNIGALDHTATRVRAQDRDKAILEFMSLTNYDFQFAIYVNSLNSITSVARLAGAGYAQVFTSGVEPFTTVEASGPTERFILNYGTRVHHMAFVAEDIDETVAKLKADGMGFLSDLVGSPEEGLQQAFSDASPHTLLVNEYIRRYGDFDGFFTKSNVTALTRATDKQ